MMKLNRLILSLSVILYSLITAAADLKSPIPSSVEGLDIPNSHVVASDNERPLVVRGMAPLTYEQVLQLKNLGIETVLIFREDPEGQNESEKNMLMRIGFDVNSIKEIPFKWKDIDNFKESCTQALEALRLLRDAVANEKPIFFHCTVGEDRTGVLAGLFEQLLYKTDKNKIFKEKMCENGYAEGDPNKPLDRVVSKIHETLTPFYLKMAYKIEMGYLTIDKLNNSQCDIDPDSSEYFNSNPEYDPKDFVCETSSKAEK